LRTLVAVNSEALSDETLRADNGEPVILSLPTQPKNLFLGVLSGKYSPCASVVDTTHEKIELIREVLKSDYPGLPGDIIDSHVDDVTAAAELLDVDKVVRLDGLTAPRSVYTDVDHKIECKGAKDKYGS
jgi:hypothetical protein